MIRPYLLSLAIALSCALLPNYAAAQDEKKMSPAEYRTQLGKDTQSAMSRMRQADPTMERFFKDSVGYAVFPRVGKLGFIFAGGHGDGEVFEKGSVVGTASVTIATVGFQAGAQEFTEIIFFQNQAALDRFKQNRFEFTANISAVIVKAGAGKAADYREGVAVFAQPTAGAMAELAIGTQKFNFKPGK